MFSIVTARYWIIINLIVFYNAAGLTVTDAHGYILLSGFLDVMMKICFFFSVSQYVWPLHTDSEGKQSAIRQKCEIPFCQSYEPNAFLLFCFFRFWTKQSFEVKLLWIKQNSSSQRDSSQPACARHYKYECVCSCKETKKNILYETWRQSRLRVLTHRA